MKQCYKDVWAGMKLWKISIIRCLIYGGIVAWGMFVAGTEGFERLNDMTQLQLIKLLGNMFFTGFCGVIVAFLDQSIQRIAKRSDTEVFYRPPDASEVKQPLP